MVTTGKFPGNILGISGKFLEETKNPRALESSDSGHREFSKELKFNKEVEIVTFIPGESEPNDSSLSTFRPSQNDVDAVYQESIFVNAVVTLVETITILDEKTSWLFDWALPESGRKF